MVAEKQAVLPPSRLPWGGRARRDLRKNWSLYLMAVPVLAFYIIFCYAPMYGAIIAFKEFSPRMGILGSPWVGLGNFQEFFSSIYAWRIIRNTLVISITSLVFGFPAPILLALLINEVKSRVFVKSVQTLTYLPHFISLVVICGMIKSFTAENGIITNIAVFFGADRHNLLGDPGLFVPIYVISGIWQGVGWGSIIYLAAIMGIDQELYEAAIIDGAGRWRQVWNITIPCILPTIVILLILRLGQIMGVGFEKIILLYNTRTMETADVIASFVYRAGLQDGRYGYSAAVGLFNSGINLVLVLAANRLSRALDQSTLW